MNEYSKPNNPKRIWASKKQEAKKKIVEAAYLRTVFFRRKNEKNKKIDWISTKFVKIWKEL